MLSEELKQLAYDIRKAGKARSSFALKGKLSEKEKTLVAEAKNCHLEYLRRKGEKRQRRLESFWQSLSEKSRKEMSLQEANLRTDNAISHMQLLEALPSLPLEKYYDFHLETYVYACEAKFQYLTLKYVSEEVEKITGDQELNLIFRKLIATDVHICLVDEMLRKGANPLDKGEKSGLNAIDRAKKEGHHALAEKLEQYVANRSLESSSSMPVNSKASKDQHYIPSP